MKPDISVLVIDDDQTMRNAMSGLLRSEMGIQDIATAGNGLQGWKALAEKPFDVVLVDWVMPSAGMKIKEMKTEINAVQSPFFLFPAPINRR